VRLRLLKRFDVPSRSDLVVFAGYCAAAAVYITVGVAYNDFLLSVIVGMGYLVLAAWFLPAAVRRLRR
jgi:hypothetical protein